MPTLRAYSSSSGGAAWAGATRGQSRGSTPGVSGRFQGDLNEKMLLINFVAYASVMMKIDLGRPQSSGSDSKVILGGKNL